MLEIFLTIFSLGLGISGCWFVLKNKINKTRQQNQKISNQLKNYKQQYNKFVVQTKDKIKKKISELQEKSKEQSEIKIKKVISDYQQALKLQTQSLQQKVMQLDQQLGDKLRQISLKNTLYFTCACDRGKQIPCSVDLSQDQNYFTCPECGAVYRVVINASTILMSGVSNNRAIASMYDGVEVGDIDRTPL